MFPGNGRYAAKIQSRRDRKGSDRSEVREQRSNPSDESYDRVYAVHTLYFRDDPLAHLSEAYRVCRLSGQIVLAFGPSDTVRRLLRLRENAHMDVGIGIP